MHKTYRKIARSIREQIPEILWIDRDKGQLKNPDDFHTIIVPGLLLGFGNVAWTGLSQGSQQGSSTMRASLVFHLPASTYQPEDPTDPFREYNDSGTLFDALHDTLTCIPEIGERRASGELFTDQYYVLWSDYDLETIHCMTVSKVQKPSPTIQATIKLPYQS